MWITSGIPVKSSNLDILRTVGPKKFISAPKTLIFLANISKVKFCNMTPKILFSKRTLETGVGTRADFYDWFGSEIFGLQIECDRFNLLREKM
jgi:hypothetical protein